MKKKKHHVGLIVLIVVLIVLAGACAAGGSSDSSDTKEITQAETSGEKETTEAPQESSSEAVTETVQASSTEEESSQDTVIGEQVLMDAEGVRITAKGYETDDIWGDGVQLLIENDSEKNVGVSCSALIVNNYMISDLFSTKVAAGKKANETMYLSSSELEAAGIENVGQIEICFYLFDPDSYETTYEADLVTIKTSHYDDMDTTPNDEGTELVNENGIRIVGRYVDENSFWGNAIVLYLENTTDENVTVQCDDMSVNGYMVTPYFSCMLYPHKMAVDDITLMESELEENNITSVDEVELTFHVFDTDTYDTVFDTDPVTFSTK